MIPRRLLLPLLTCCVLVAYQPAWHGGMLWDDDAHVTRPALRGVDGLKAIWVTPGATQQYYPLLHSAFWLQHRLWGDATTGYHIVSILLHAAAAFLIALLLRRLAVPGAELAALVFALHPVHVESVAWITELKNTLSGVLYLGAALAYLDFDATRRRKSYLIAAALFVLALLTKTVTASLPAALLVVFWWKRGRVRWRDDAVPLTPFFAVGATAGLFTAWVERALVGAQGAEFQLSALERVQLAGRAVWFYAGKLLWPADLAFIYPRWRLDDSDPGQYAYVAATAAVLVILWAIRGRSRGPLAAALLFIGTLFPVLGFFDVFPFRYSFVADHFQYLASIGPIALLSAALASAFARRRAAFAAAGAVTALALGVLTWHQSHRYRDAQTLYAVTLEQNPACWMCHNNLGMMLLAASSARAEEALRHFEQGLRLQPLNPEGHNNRGVALRWLGRHEEAAAAFAEALRLSPRFAEARVNLASADLRDSLGVSLARAGRYEDAFREFEAALRAEPGHPAARRNLAVAHDDYGYLLLKSGDVRRAAEQFEAALRVDSGYAPAAVSLGNLLLREDRPRDAIAYFERALSRPDQVDAPQVHNLLGVALALSGRRAAAIAQFREALRLRPGYEDARANLARAGGGAR